MADSRDITGKNRKFTGTSGIKLPEGTEAQRVNVAGQVRFNTESNLAEYYDGTIWKSIDSPPTVDAFSPSTPVDDGSTVTEITITGTNFQSGLTLDLIGSDGTAYSVSSFTRVSSTSITFNYTSALAAAGANSPYTIRVTNPTGLSGTLNGFIPNTGPIFNTASGSLGSINFGANGSTFTQISVTDTAGGTLVYSISAGALPDGVSINSATGALSGVTTVSGTFSFTVQVTDGTTTVTRDFNATVISPFLAATGGTETTEGDYKIHTFTSPGTFTVTNAGAPAGPNVVDYLVVGGGGGGRAATATGGGGAGGFRLSNATGMPAPETSPLANPTGLTLPATSYPVTVGAGTTQASPAGSPSTFSTITSAGGGSPNGNNEPGRSGGSGGAGIGGSAPGFSNPSAGGAGNTPPVSPPQGNTGGRGYDGQVVNTQGGGGGGAGAVGGNAGPGSGAPGGVGSYVLATGFAGANGTTGPVPGVRYFAGGGGGGTDTPAGSTFPGGSGGGGRGGNGGVAGTINTGGGGGGGPNNNAGGSGIVIIRYKYQ